MRENMLNIITRFEDQLKRNYPYAKIKIFYDKNNMKTYETAFSVIEIAVMSCVKEICKLKKRNHIYVRIHAHNGWGVVRIMGEGNLDEESICKLKYRREIINVENFQKTVVIKISCYLLHNR